MKTQTKKQGISRRQFLKHSALLMALPGWLTGCEGNDASQPKDWFISGSDDMKGNHRLSVFDSEGKSILNIPVKQRVHGQAVNPVNTNQIIFFARRPGTDAYVLDLTQLKVTARFEAGKNRHFFGHGTFSEDGKYLYSCENNFSDGTGVISVRDTSTWQKLSEFPAYGIGTHQIVLMPDGKHLAVANGGIKTHPDFPRKKLNLDTMKPSLTYIELESGKHIASYKPTHHQMSIRHLDVSRDETVGIAIQYQGSKLDTVPLIAFHKGEDKLRYAEADNNIWQGMKQYTAGIAMDSDRQVAAVTTPRGNNISFWDMKTGGFLHRETLTDVSGVAFSSDTDHFIATTGLGDVYTFKGHSLVLSRTSRSHYLNTRWDNHMNSIPSIDKV